MMYRMYLTTPGIFSSTFDYPQVMFLYQLQEQLVLTRGPIDIQKN